MREIKFRVYVPTDVDENDNGCDFIMTDALSFSGKGNMPLNEVIAKFPHPTMQYTGLKDINGVEIYEGDIVADRDSDFVFAVKWNDEWGGYKAPDDYDEENHVPLSDLNTEIIGNIYENPELLKNE